MSGAREEDGKFLDPEKVGGWARLMIFIILVTCLLGNELTGQWQKKTDFDHT